MDRENAWVLDDLKFRRISGLQIWLKCIVICKAVDKTEVTEELREEFSTRVINKKTEIAFQKYCENV